MSDVPVTTITSSAGGATIRATASVELEALAQGVISTFEERSADWRDGYSIGFGWGPLFLREEDGGYRVVAPDFAVDPRGGTTDDLTLSIWLMVALNALPTAAGVDAADIAYDDDVICVKGWQERGMLSLTRIATTTPHDSGWFVEPFPPESAEPWRADQLVRLPAWQVLRARRAVARCLALPVGVTAIVEGDVVRTLVRDSDREVLAGGPL
ncbi:hypothetical protein [Microbacterium sp. NPDC055683]